MLAALISFLLIGWNLLGLGAEGNADEFTDRWPCVTAIWLYNGTWVGYFPGHPEASDFPHQEFQPSRGYWVYCQFPKEDH